MIAQYVLPIQNKLSIIATVFKNCNRVIRVTSARDGKERGNLPSIKFPFSIEPIMCQHGISQRCRKHVMQRRIESLICFSTLRIILELNIAITPSWNGCQLVSNNEGQILVWRNITQFYSCSTVLRIWSCTSTIRRQGWIVEVVNGITQFCYLITVKVCKWLVCFALGKEHSGVIFVRS